MTTLFPLLLGDILLAVSLIFNPYGVENQILTWLLLLLTTGVGLLFSVEKIPRLLFIPATVLLCSGLWNLPDYANSSMGMIKLGLSVFCLLLAGSGALKAKPLIVLLYGILVTSRGIMDLFLPNLMRGIEHTMTSFFIHKNMFGYALIALFWWTLYTWMSNKEKRTWLQHGIRFLLGLITFCFLSLNSRSALLGLALSLVLYLAVHIWKSHRFRLLPLSLLPLLLLPLGTWIGGYRSLAGDSRAFYEYTQSQENETAYYSSANTRIRLWLASIKSWKEAPWLGKGEGSIEYELERRQGKNYNSLGITPLHAHSHYLEILHDRGALGFLVEMGLWILALIAFGRGAFKQNAPSDLALLCTLLSLSVQNVFAEASEYPASVVIWWSLLGIGAGRFSWIHSTKKFLSENMIRPARGSVLALTLILLGLGIPVMASDYWLYRFFVTPATKERMMYLNRSGEWGVFNLNYGYQGAKFLAHQGMLQQALEFNQEMEKKTPWYSVSRVQRARLLYTLGQYDKAMKTLDSLIDFYPQNLEVEQIYLALLRKKGRCEEHQKKIGAIRQRFEKWRKMIRSREFPDPYHKYPPWAAWLNRQTHPPQAPDSTEYKKALGNYTKVLRQAKQIPCETEALHP